MINKLEKETNAALAVFEKAKQRLVRVIDAANAEVEVNKEMIDMLGRKNDDLRKISSNAFNKASKINEILS